MQEQTAAAYSGDRICKYHFKVIKGELAMVLFISVVSGLIGLVLLVWFILAIRSININTILTVKQLEETNKMLKAINEKLTDIYVQISRKV